MIKQFIEAQISDHDKQTEDHIEIIIIIWNAV